MSPGLPSATTIDHIGITVPDLYEAIAFFESLGFELLYEEGPYRDSGDALRRQVDVDPSAEYSLAMMSFRSTTTLELLEYRIEDATKAPPRNSDHSAAHLGLRVEDIDAAAEHMRAAGHDVFDGPVEVDDGPSVGLKWIYVRAPWGLQLELVELPPRMAAQLPG